MEQQDGEYPIMVVWHRLAPTVSSKTELAASISLDIKRFDAYELSDSCEDIIKDIPLLGPEQQITFSAQLEHELTADYRH